jgi:hypothetical protein
MERHYAGSGPVPATLGAQTPRRREALNKYLTLDQLITPTIIMVIYWIGIVLIILGALGSMFAGLGAFFFGIIGAIIGLILWRVWCEIMLVLFRVHEDLRQIARNTTPVGAVPPV